MYGADFGDVLLIGLNPTRRILFFLLLLLLFFGVCFFFSFFILFKKKTNAFLKRPTFTDLSLNGIDITMYMTQFYAYYLKHNCRCQRAEPFAIFFLKKKKKKKKKLSMYTWRLLLHDRRTFRSTTVTTQTTPKDRRYNRIFVLSPHKSDSKFIHFSGYTITVLYIITTWEQYTRFHGDMQ